MARLIPSSEDEPADDAGPRVVGLDSDDADDLLGAMSSDTARDLLAALHAEPATASELADRVDTSLQNAQYHLGKLADAGVIEVVDTAYSEKGREMKVYAPADDPLVVVAGDEDSTDGLRSMLAGLLGGLAILGVGGLLVQVVLGGDPGRYREMAAMETTDAASGLPVGLLTEPGVLFFAGGATVLLVALVVRYYRG